MLLPHHFMSQVTLMFSLAGVLNQYVTISILNNLFLPLSFSLFVLDKLHMLLLRNQ